MDAKQNPMPAKRGKMQQPTRFARAMRGVGLILVVILTTLIKILVYLTNLLKPFIIMILTTLIDILIYLTNLLKPFILLAILLFAIRMKVSLLPSMDSSINDLSPTTVPTFTFPNARLLSPADHTGTTTDFRVLVNEGTLNKAIKYVSVSHEVIALTKRKWLCGPNFAEMRNSPAQKRTPHQPIKYATISYEVNAFIKNMFCGAIEMPHLPTGDWKYACIGLSGNRESTMITGLDCKNLPGVENRWHQASFEYVDLTVHPMAGSKDHVKLVSHPFLSTPGNLAVMKYATFPEDIPFIEKETAIYRDLVGFKSAPTFLGHVTENGRVVGFLLEYIEPGVPEGNGHGFLGIAIEKCRNAMVDLHRRGVVHNDAHPGNCLFRPTGEAVWIDYEHAQASVAKGHPDFERDFNFLNAIRV